MRYDKLRNSRRTAQYQQQQSEGSLRSRRGLRGQVPATYNASQQHVAQIAQMIPSALNATDLNKLDATTVKGAFLSILALQSAVKPARRLQADNLQCYTIPSAPGFAVGCAPSSSLNVTGVTAYPNGTVAAGQWAASAGTSLDLAATRNNVPAATSIIKARLNPDPKVASAAQSVADPVIQSFAKAAINLSPADPARSDPSYAELTCNYLFTPGAPPLSLDSPPALEAARNQFVWECRNLTSVPSLAVFPILSQIANRTAVGTLVSRNTSAAVAPYMPNVAPNALIARPALTANNTGSNIYGLDISLVDGTNNVTLRGDSPGARAVLTHMFHAVTTQGAQYRALAPEYQNTTASAVLLQLHGRLQTLQARIPGISLYPNHKFYGPNDAAEASEGIASSVVNAGGEYLPSFLADMKTNFTNSDTDQKDQAEFFAIYGNYQAMIGAMVGDAQVQNPNQLAPNQTATPTPKPIKKP